MTAGEGMGGRQFTSKVTAQHIQQVRISILGRNSHSEILPNLISGLAAILAWLQLLVAQALFSSHKRATSTCWQLDMKSTSHRFSCKYSQLTQTNQILFLTYVTCIIFKLINLQKGCFQRSLVTKLHPTLTSVLENFHITKANFPWVWLWVSLIFTTTTHGRSTIAFTFKITGAFSWVNSALNYFEMLQDFEETLSYLFLVSKE